MNVGKVILNQMLTINKFYVLSWGAHAYKTFSSSQLSMLNPHLGGLIFRVNGKKHKGNVIVSLQGNDLYRIYVGQLRMGKINVKNEITDIHVEDLVDTIDELVET